MFLQDNTSITDGDSDQIKDQAKIFGRGQTAKSLTKWQQAINEEAGMLAVESPVYLTNRGNVYLEEAENEFSLTVLVSTQ